MTLQHPLFGVGAGQFSIQAWEARRKQGLSNLYNETHNTYTQVSSELGIPAFILFLGVLVSSFSAMRSVTKLRSSKLYRVPKEVLDTADSLLLSMVVLCVCGFFLSLAWGPLFFVMPAIIAGFQRSVQSALPGWAVAPVVQAIPAQAAPPVKAAPLGLPTHPAATVSGRSLRRRLLNAGNPRPGGWR
jgi:O-antigen ligase